MRISSDHGVGSSVDEISLYACLEFLNQNWRVILFSAFSGVILSAVYLFFAPKRYEAVAQIAMAQIAMTGNSTNPMGVNIEDPPLLIARLTSPASFTPSVIANCGYQNNSNAGLLLSKSVTMTIPRGVNSVIELKGSGATPKVASECVLAMFQMIQLSQSEMIAPYINEAKVKLSADEQRLDKAKMLVAMSEKHGRGGISAVSLATLDEMRGLNEDISNVKNLIAMSSNRPTRLIAPIYSNQEPASPKPRMIFAIGFFGGIFFGLLIWRIRKTINDFKNANNRDIYLNKSGDG